MSFFIYFIDAPLRTHIGNQPIRSPLLEECRSHLSGYAKTYLPAAFAIAYKGRIDYAWFNYTGHLQYYISKGIHYVFEISCDIPTLYQRVYDDRIYTVSVEDCQDLFTSLTSKALEYSHKTYANRWYQGGVCFSHAWHDKYPVQSKPPPEYASYRIRPARFYLNTFYGRRFKSPTIAAYQRFIHRGLPYIDDGTPEPDYIDDYWEGTDQNDFHLF